MTSPPLYPLPEALRGRRGERWEITGATRSAAQPCTHPAKRRMVVPVGDDCPLCSLRHDFAVRVHEMAHARWSPIRPGRALRHYGVSFEDCAAVEELRIALLLERTGIWDLPPCLCEWEATGLARRSVATSLRVAVEVALSSMGTTDWTSVESALTSMPAALDLRAHSALRLSWMAFALLGESRLAWTDTCRVAVILRDALHALEPFDREPHRWARPVAGVGSDAVDAALGELVLSSAESLGARWGTMTIDEPGRTVRTVARGRLRPRAAGEGSALARPDRFCVDRRVFARRPTGRGGTVLVDVSGSMQLTQSDLRRMLLAAPAGTVAIYAGDDRGRGVLRIVAQRGSRVPDALLGGLGALNVIDGPALEWLAGEPAPRVWVSDGRVTGVPPTGTGEVASGRLRLETLAICSGARIQEVCDLDRAVRALTTRLG